MVENGAGAGVTLASGFLGISTEHIGHRVADKRGPAGNLAKFAVVTNIVTPSEWKETHLLITSMHRFHML